MSVCHGKRNSYSTDFKLKVLEFYLKNGGENVFGLKSRTAEHFNIGKKTVVRIVESKDALMRAKNSKSKKSVDSVTKSASTSKVTGHTKKVHTAGGSGKGNITAVKSVPSQGSKTLVLSVKTANKVSSKSVATKKESKKEVAAAAESAPVKSSSATPRVSEERKRPTDVRGEHEEVLELPEDPDYAILKIPIDGGTTATGVAGPALLLSTATDEVRRALVYECEVLYECKVCRSLFRSVVNFLAHKRIFCTLSHNSEKTFYNEGESSHLTPHSSTVISSAAPASGGSARVSTRKCHQASASTANSSATDVGSSAYFGRLERVERKRAAASEDCKVVLESAGEGVSNAVYQTFQHPDAPAVQPSLQDARLTVREHERGVMAVLGKDGRIVSTVGLDHQNLADLPCSDEASVQLPSAAGVEVKEEPINLDDDEEYEEQQESSVLATEQLSKASCEEFDETTKPQIEQHHQAVKNNSSKGKDSSKVSWSPGGDGVVSASPSFSDVVVKTEANDAVSTGSSLRSKRVECGGGGDGGFAKRWMCNVCGKLYVTHTASLGHAATHSDSSFLPKPQLVDVFISRKAFSKVVPRQFNTGSVDVKDPQFIGQTENAEATNRERLNSNNHSLLSSEKTSGELGNDHVSSRQSSLELTDVAAFNILKTNNMRYREEAFPFQSMDQRGALEKSIKKIYDRHQSLAGEPKAHEVLLQTRRAVEKLGFQPQQTDSGPRAVSSKKTILSNASNNFSALHRGNKLQAVTGANKRKMNLMRISNFERKSEFEPPSRRRKEDLSSGSQDDFTSANFSSSNYPVKRKLSEPHSEASSHLSSPMPPHLSKSASEQSATSCTRSSASSSAESERHESRRSDSDQRQSVPSERVQSSFPDSLFPNSSNNKLLDSGAQLAGVKTSELALGESSASSTSCVPTTSDNGSESRDLKAKHNVSTTEDVSAPQTTTYLSADASVKSTSNAWNLYEEDWADEEEEEGDLVSSGSASANGDLYSVSSINSRDSASRGSDLHSQRNSVLTEAVEAKTSTQLNSASELMERTSSSECGRSFLPGVRGSSMSASSSRSADEFSRTVVLERSKNGDRACSDSVIQSKQILSNNNGNDSTNDRILSVNISPEASSSRTMKPSTSKQFASQSQPCTSFKETSLNLFDCGSMAEQELEDERHASKVHPFSGLLAGPSSSSARDDTLMQEASSLGLFDTGFEECRLHSDRLDDEVVQSPREQSPVAGPSYR